MRVAILTQYFPPEMGAPQARLSELALRLQRRGHELTIITAMPNYPTGKVFGEYRRRLFCRENVNDLKVIRCPIMPTKSANLIVRFVSYMSFVVTSLFMGTWSVGKQDVLIVESPPLFLGLSGIPMSRLTRSKMVLMVSDIWPDVAIRMGDIIGDRQAKILEKLEGLIYRRSACVAVTNPGAVEQIESRFPQVRCGVISNGVDTNLFKPDFRSESIRTEFGIEPGQFAVAYCGLHGIFQGLEVVIEAAKFLSDSSNIRFVMIGDGPTKESLMVKAEEAGLKNIAFYSKQPKNYMPSILASMDTSLIPLAAELPGTMPSKVYEALASGVPMVVTAGCEAEELVRRYNVGKVFQPADAGQLADVLNQLASDKDQCNQMRANSLELAKRFDRSKITDLAEQLLLAVSKGEPLPKVVW